MPDRVEGLFLGYFFRLSIVQGLGFRVEGLGFRVGEVKEDEWRNIGNALQHAGIYNRDPLARDSSSHLEPPDIIVPHSDTSEGY